MSLISYVLSEAAEKDVSDIHDYTLSRHGKRQVTKYLEGLHVEIGKLVKLPKSGRV